VNVRLAQAGAAPGPAGGAATPGSGAAPRSGGGFSAPGGGFSAPATPTAPGPGAGLGANGRLLDRIERIGDNLAPRPLSTVYNPEAFAALQARVEQLENRLRAIESRMGGSPTGAAPAGSPAAPGFNAPSAPSTTPGFGSPGGTAP